jgi:phosphoglycerate dehydrogenase-like enzyme
MIMHPVVREELVRDAHLERLQRSCRLLDASPFRDFAGLGEQSERVQVLITSWGCPHIDRAAASTMPGLKLIAHIAGSVKGFIDETVWRMGVQVTNAVAANAIPVAEFTLAAILLSNKRVLQLAEFYRRHHENHAPWTKEAPNAGNYGKVVGIIGASHVGRKVIELLRPFDLKVLLYDPYISPLQGRELGAHKVGLTELLSNADVVSMHAPLLPETRHMLGAREFAQMKDGTTFINTARGAVIDQGALEAELVSGRLNAVLDTTEPEVLPSESPLYRLPNVLLTPHIAGSLGNEMERLADCVIDEVERFARGQPLRHRVRHDELARLA